MVIEQFLVWPLWFCLEYWAAWNRKVACDLGICGTESFCPADKRSLPVASPELVLESFKTFAICFLPDWLKLRRLPLRSGRGSLGDSWNSVVSASTEVRTKDLKVMGDEVRRLAPTKSFWNWVSSQVLCSCSGRFISPDETINDYFKSSSSALKFIFAFNKNFTFTFNNTLIFFKCCERSAYFIWRAKQTNTINVIFLKVSINKRYHIHSQTENFLLSLI